MVDQDAAIQNLIDNLSYVECNDEGDEGSCDESILAFYYVFFFQYSVPRKLYFTQPRFAVFFQFLLCFSAKYLLLKVYFYSYTVHNRHTKLIQVFAVSVSVILFQIMSWIARKHFKNFFYRKRRFFGKIWDFLRLISQLWIIIELFFGFSWQSNSLKVTFKLFSSM